MEPQTTTDIANETNVAPEPVSSPQFDFYTLLSDSEVIVPEVEAELRPGLELVEIDPDPDTAVTRSADESTSTDNNSQSSAAVATEDSTISYILQAGSFRNRDEAEAVRVNLLLLNLPVSIQTVENLGDTWHRVIVGPYSTAVTMSSARNILQSNSIESIVLKRSND